jgi:hypothetical protein
VLFVPAMRQHVFYGASEPFQNRRPLQLLLENVAVGRSRAHT